MRGGTFALVLLGTRRPDALVGTRTVPMVIAGIVFGVAVRLSWALPEQQFAWTHRDAWPWALAAFAVGGVATSRRMGARDGAIVLCVAVLAYYAVMAFAEGKYDHSPVGVVWLLAALPAGLCFGYVGAVWRTADMSKRALAASLLFAIVTVEAVYSSGVLVDVLREARSLVSL